MFSLALNVVSLAGQRTDGDGATVDSRLLAASARGDSRSFEQIIGRHYHVVHRVVWRMMNGHSDAEDVTQEAFLRLWRNPVQVREAGALRGWLIRVATNLVTDRHRGAPAMELTLVDEIPDSRLDSEDIMNRNVVARRMDEAVAKLPDRQKLAIALVQFEHLSNPDAARVMEVSVDALESLLARARRTLKQELADEWRGMLDVLATEK